MKSLLPWLISATAYLFFAIVNGDLASDRAALVALRTAVGGRPRRWNIYEPSPCHWIGVHCQNNRVTVLRLPGMGLSGNLPLGIGNLTQLQTLSLRFNHLSGSIPADFVNLVSLRNLYLQNNFFSGEIPDFIFDMKILVNLNLADNNFSGEISPKFDSLTRLNTLYLENNHFSGSIPELNSSRLKKFNVSNNLLNGSIPARLSNLNASSFQGNSLCGKPLPDCPGRTESGRKLSGGEIAGIVIGSVVGVLFIILILFFLCKKRGSKSKDSKDIASKSKDLNTASENVRARCSAADKSEVTGNVSESIVLLGNINRVFDLEALLRASAEVLGKGTFGTTYKASLDEGMVLAVKRLKDVTEREREFRMKMEELGKMVHENLVQLTAYYYNRDEKLLVYDYLPMGSLSALLHGNSRAGRTPLNWETRSEIALGAARGIAYLHSHGPDSSHGNIKSSNILLTNFFQARVSDFGLAHLALPTTPNRASGYRAPEVTDFNKVSQKADVYSFGVILLELLTGKAPCCSLLNEGEDLPSWVQSVAQEEWNTEVFDMELLRYQSVEDGMIKFLQLALQCAAQCPDNRPSMDMVASKIEEICHSSSEEEEEETSIL